MWQSKSQSKSGFCLNNQIPNFGIDIFYNDQDMTIKGTFSHFADNTKFSASVDLLEGQKTQDWGAFVAPASKIWAENWEN